MIIITLTIKNNLFILLTILPKRKKAKPEISLKKVNMWLVNEQLMTTWFLLYLVRKRSEKRNFIVGITKLNCFKVPDRKLFCLCIINKVL